MRRQARHDLRRTITGEEAVVVDPAEQHRRILRKWQNDMVSAEDQRAGAIEAARQREPVAAAALGQAINRP